MVSDTSAAELLRPLVTGWQGRIRRAVEHRKAWQDVADQCMAFFAGSLGFMWEDEYRRRFMKGSLNPKFKISLNKAFELVAVFGPVLYHRNPVRACRPYKAIEFPEEAVVEAMGVSPDLIESLNQAEEQASQMSQAGQPIPWDLQQQLALNDQIRSEVGNLMEADAREKSLLRVTCQLVEQYLSYTPREQPNGGLEQAAEDAITEMLIKGRGVLFPRPYTMPGSDTKMTGCFYESVNRVVTDPDAKTINFGDAQWMALLHHEPLSLIERRFKLSPGALKGKGTTESGEAQVDRQESDLGNLQRERGETADIGQWWEVWSIGGATRQMTGISPEMDKLFSDTVGDFAYICVMDGVSYPLNASPQRMQQASEAEVRKLFAWPVPYYLDQRWPCAFLEAYRDPGYCYPIAPMKPGLGELTALNVIISHLCSRIWNASRTIVAVLESAKSYVDKALKSGDDMVVIGIKEIHQDINKVISEFQHKDVSFDVWRIVDRLFDIFDKRVGLSDLLYGMQGPQQSRSATDVTVREEKLNVRPDHMAKKVDSWMSEAARMEKLCAYWSGIEGRDVRPLLGTLGATLWDRLVATADPETVIREMDCTVEAGTARKPNKARDAANIGQIFPPLLQVLDKHADTTTDTGPLNGLITQMGEAIDHNMKPVLMGSRMPPPPPPGAEDPAAMEMEARGAELARDEAAHAQEIRQKEEEHSQAARQREEEHNQKIRLTQAEARIKRLAATQTRQTNSQKVTA